MEPFWNPALTPDEMTQQAAVKLAAAKAILERLYKPDPKRTLRSAIAEYDEALRLAASFAICGRLIALTHPDPLVRETAGKVAAESGNFMASLPRDAKLFHAFQALSRKGASPMERKYAEESEKMWRLGGADRSDADRAKLEAIQEAASEAASTFGANTAKGRRTIEVRDRLELAGLPEDWLASRKGDVVTVSTDYPDYFPVMNFASNEGLRRRLYFEFRNRAWPANEEVLHSLIAKRHEEGRMHGFPNAAAQLLRTNMVETPAKVKALLGMADAASKSRAAAEYAELLALKRRDTPATDALDDSEKSYWQERVRRANFEVDESATREYFPLAQVKQGVLDVTGRLFGLAFRRVPDAPVWHPSVECWEALDNGKLIGRFYWDLHPRKNKYTHGAEFPIRSGKLGRQLPEVVLLTNFPEQAPALMSHAEVKTFFHEFGHVLHDILSGQQQYFNFSGTPSIEQDFVEVPSQLLEEFLFDHAVLATFARHYKTGEVIPADLVKRMRAAAAFGRGLHARQMLLYSDFNLRAHELDPPQGEYTAMFRESFEKYMPFRWLDGVHPYASFEHIAGYPASYYTYLWDQLIVKDLFQRFDKTNLFDPRIARRYRETILAPGSTRSARELTEDFLGRPVNADAWRKWMEAPE